LSDLPNYIAEFSAMMKRHNQERFITLMPALGIALATCFKQKEKEGIHQFRSIATEVAVLVKKNTVVH
jgi:hypothetical protein